MIIAWIQNNPEWCGLIAAVLVWIFMHWHINVYSPKKHMKESVREVASELDLVQRERARIEDLKDMDFSLQKGDEVKAQHWSLGKLYVVDVNWALRAAAIRLGENGGIVVWPVKGLKKVKA